MQPLHGSPYHVYPASNYPAVKAFQGPNPSLHNVSASPLLSTKSQVQMEMSSILRPSSPQTPRINNLPRRQTIQETSFSNNIDTDAVVAKINNMFPTASENHIRLLLKKYLKNVFPKADETLLLDILANSDNNVQKASEKLVSMGYTKRDMLAAPKLSSRMEEAKRTAESSDEKIIPLHPKVLTAEEKESIKQTLQTQYKSIAERIILMALESVNYSEDRASQILQIVLQEDESKEKKKKPKEGETSKLEGVVKEEPETISERSTPKTTSDEDSPTKKEFQSILKRIAAKGPNSELCNGPNEDLLLADYVTWSGANPDISLGRKGIAQGADATLLSDRNTTLALGHNNELCKGPQVGLAKGSIYSQINCALNTNVKCN